MNIRCKQVAVMIAVLNVGFQIRIANAELETDKLPSPAAVNVLATKATDILFEKANFWESRKRGDLARIALQRILDSEPGNEQALYMLGMSHSREGNTKEAKNVLKRIVSANPRSGYIAQLSEQIKNSSFDQTRLKRARQLQAAGNPDEALEEYEYLFVGREKRGPVALEYYHTMSSIQERRQEAISGLRDLQLDEPGNDDIAFTLAQILTYDGETRRQGLDMLRVLAEKPAYRVKAANKYREALLWLDASSQDEGYFQYYIEQNPQDKKVTERLQSLTSSIDPSSYDGLLIYGFESLNSNKLRKAKSLFKQATEMAEDNAEAWAGLALVEQRQGSHASALRLYNKALKKDPSLNTKYRNAISSAQFWSSVTKIKQPKYQNDPVAALSHLETLKPSSTDENRELALQRSRLYAQAGAFEKATRSYEQVLLKYPGEERAIDALLNIAIGTEDYRQLSRLFVQYEKMLEKSSTSKPLKMTLYRVAALLQVQRSENTQAVATFKKALSIDPNAIWLRLDYARLLLALNRPKAAKRIADGIPVSGDNKINGYYARALFYSDIEDWNSVTALLDNIPQVAKTKEMIQLRLAARFRQAIDSAIRQGELRGVKVAEEALIGLYESSPNVDGATFLIVSALEKFKLRKVATAIIEQAIRENAKLSVDERLAFASYLTQWGEFSLSNMMITTLDREPELTTNQRMQLSAVKLQALLDRSANAIEGQAYSQAQTYLNTALQLDPKNPGTLRMLGQLNQLRGNINESIRYYREAIDIDPRDLWAIKGAVGTALESGNLIVAREVLDSAIEQLPNEPDVYELLARVAQAAGETKIAIESMAHARALRKQSSRK